MKRPTDPYAALHAYIEQHRDTPFAWGVHDCCMFAAGGVLAITGRDPAKTLKLRGRYRSAQGATNVLRKFGGDLTRIPPAAGLTPLPVRAARRCDVVAAPVGAAKRLALGLCAGPRAAFAGPAGLVWLATLDCTHAWRI